MTTEIETPQKVREEFAARELSISHETASSAVAAQATAAIQARYVMALQRPRDWDDVRVRLTKECTRPTFAKVARYRKPIGAGVEGPSIRFVEAAIRCMTNVLCETNVLYDDREKRILRITVTDLEANTPQSTEVVVSKTVERHKLPAGEKPLGIRTNSQGKTVYILPATDDDILNKQGAIVSKALRTNGMRLIPGDLTDECMEIVKRVVAQGIAADPDAERKRLADAFAALNIPPSELKRYLGCDLGQASPAQLDELRALYTAIKDGEATWREAMDARDVEPDPPAGGDAPPANPQASALKEKLAAAQDRLRSKKPNGAPATQAEGGMAPAAADSGSPSGAAGPEAEGSDVRPDDGDGVSLPDLPPEDEGPEDPNAPLTDDERAQVGAAVKARAAKLHKDPTRAHYSALLGKAVQAMRIQKQSDFTRGMFPSLIQTIGTLS